MPRHTELADEEHVERDPERPCHLVGDRDTATRQPEDHNVVAPDVIPELGGQDPTGVDAIGKVVLAADSLRLGADAMSALV